MNVPSFGPRLGYPSGIVGATLIPAKTAVFPVLVSNSIPGAAMEPMHAGACPVEVMLHVLSGKWKPMILHHLHRGTQRFGELRRLLPDATPQMLTAHLRELERDGLVHREVYAQVPPKVEYSLTEIGRSLGPVVVLMAKWGEDYSREKAARFT